MHDYQITGSIVTCKLTSQNSTVNVHIRSYMQVYILLSCNMLSCKSSTYIYVTI